MTFLGMCIALVVTKASNKCVHQVLKYHVTVTVTSIDVLTKDVLTKQVSEKQNRILI
jgi:hypothetical protein